jgi:hypothetical protein
LFSVEPGRADRLPGYPTGVGWFFYGADFIRDDQASNRAAAGGVDLPDPESRSVWTIHARASLSLPNAGNIRGLPLAVVISTVKVPSLCGAILNVVVGMH